MKFYYCKTCKNIVYHVSDEHAPVMCCGEVMKELTANTVDASQEKHVPVVKQNGNVVLRKKHLNMKNIKGQAGEDNAE